MYETIYVFWFIYKNGHEKIFSLEPNYIFLEKTIQKYINIDTKYLKEGFIDKCICAPNDICPYEAIYAYKESW